MLYVLFFEEVGRDSSGRDGGLSSYFVLKMDDTLGIMFGVYKCFFRYFGFNVRR